RADDDLAADVYQQRVAVGQCGNGGEREERQRREGELEEVQIHGLANSVMSCDESDRVRGAVGALALELRSMCAQQWRSSPVESKNERVPPLAYPAVRSGSMARTAGRASSGTQPV